MSEFNRKLVTMVRTATGAALHVCKRALEEAKGNAEAAIAAVKKMGYALAEKKSDRVTSEGCIVGEIYELPGDRYRGGLLACQSETDFVSKNEHFSHFTKKVLNIGLKAGAKDLDALLTLAFDEDRTVEEARKGLVSQFGENIRISRYETLETVNHMGLYVHKGRYGCIVALKGAAATIAKDIAVHIVVSHPENSEELMQQDFYKDPSKKIESYLKENASEVTQYIYFVLGSEITS